MSVFFFGKGPTTCHHVSQTCQNREGEREREREREREMSIVASCCIVLTPCEDEHRGIMCITAASCGHQVVMLPLLLLTFPRFVHFIGIHDCQMAQSVSSLVLRRSCVRMCPNKLKAKGRQRAHLRVLRHASTVGARTCTHAHAHAHADARPVPRPCVGQARAPPSWAMAGSSGPAASSASCSAQCKGRWSIGDRQQGVP